MAKDIGEIWKELTDSINDLQSTNGKINGEICMIVSREEVKAAIIKHGENLNNYHREIINTIEGITVALRGDK